MRLRHVVTLLLCGLSGCESSPEPLHGALLTLRAERPHGEPLAGARFWLSGRELGPTGSDGRVSTTLGWRQGELVQVTTLCPIGYRSPPKPRLLALEHLASHGSDAPTLMISERCEPEQAEVALVVRARRADAGVSLPIVVDEQVIGNTEPSGIAHLLLHRAPGSTLQVKLDTKASATLTPRDPVRSFDIDDSQTIVLFDQTFATAPRPRTRRAPRDEIPARWRTPPRRIE